jgi:hypothetical protein
VAINSGDVIQCIVEFVDDIGEVIINKFTYVAEFLAPVAEGLVIAGINALLENLFGEIDAYINTQYDDPLDSFDIIEFIDGEWQVTGNVGNAQLSTNFTNAADVLPPTSAAYLVGQTERPRSRGRKFLPPFGEDCQDRGLLEPGVITDVGLALLHYLADINLDGGNYLHPGVASKVTGEFLPFVSGSIGEYLGTQHRRRPTVGI